jgi:hypothetical protein
MPSLEDRNAELDPEDFPQAQPDGCCHHPPLHPVPGQVEYLEIPRMKFGSHRLPHQVMRGR